MHLHAEYCDYVSITENDQFSQIEVAQLEFPTELYLAGIGVIAASHLILMGNSALGMVFLVSYSLSLLVFRVPNLSYHLFWDPNYLFIRTAILCTLFFVNPCWLIGLLSQLPSLYSAIGILSGKLLSGWK